MSALALMFVIIQLRHARAEMRRSASLARLQGTRDVFMTQATHQELASAVRLAYAAAGRSHDRSCNSPWT
jgi:hypothetical protein